MNPGAAPPPRRLAGFRRQVFTALMLGVAATTLVVLYLAERGLTARTAEGFQRAFTTELARLQVSQEVRGAALLERCRTLVRKPRIRAAFEDNALDLLYPNATDELRDILARGEEPGASQLRAQFYRFLDARGAVITPKDVRTAGALSPAEEGRLALPRIPTSPQTGYLIRQVRGAGVIAMTMAMPIISTESGEPIGALVLGFHDPERSAGVGGRGMQRGLWLDGRLHSTAFSDAARLRLAEVARPAGEPASPAAPPLRFDLDGTPHLVFSQRLNPDSLYPPADEVCAYPLDQFALRQRELRWRILGAGGLVLLLGFTASRIAARRLSQPVERLAREEEESRRERARAEAALEVTHAELQRSARFSADASHQLKTPVAVLRAGLEERLAREHLSPAECLELSGLIHQTYRLSSLIDDLLLLSRLDAGRLRLDFAPVNLSHLIAAALDDLSALPDHRAVAVDTDFPPDLLIAGEGRYAAIILHNLLDNARKYNRPAGRIAVHAVDAGPVVRLTVRNEGDPIPPAARAHIFERFHRGAQGENIAGHGLGLNLARELARLHGGELRLLRSDPHGTEFEVTFRAARTLQPAAAPA